MRVGSLRSATRESVAGGVVGVVVGAVAGVFAAREIQRPAGGGGRWGDPTAYMVTLSRRVQYLKSFFFKIVCITLRSIMNLEGLIP